MPDPAENVALMQSLGRVVRGLSALFWGLPLSLLLCAKTTVTEWLRPFGIVPPIVATGLILYGLILLGSFQRQERVWTAALDRAKLLSLAVVGLSPFLYWWNKAPEIRLFGEAAAVLCVVGLCFLLSLNRVLVRLTAMLPEEMLRHETQFFSTLNSYLLFTILLLAVAYALLSRLVPGPVVLEQIRMGLEQTHYWLLIFLVLLPVALTMTLIWKIKEVILASVFHWPRES